MGCGYLGQGLVPSSGLIHALLQGVGAPRCVCVSHARHRWGGMVAENCSGGGGAAVDREEVDDGEQVKKVKKKKLGEEDIFPGNSVRGGDPLVASGA